MSLKTIGIILIVVGVVVVLASILADSLSIGSSVGVFGTRQILGTVGGIVIAVVGAVLYWRENRKTG